MDIRAIFETIVRFLDEAGEDTPYLYFNQGSDYPAEILVRNPLSSETYRISITKEAKEKQS